jgi:predicted nucleotide-binding protein (sugar kinase/HSP70/actin superfamily)
MIEFLYKIFTTKDEREFNKLVKKAEEMLDEIENKKQLKGVVVLLNRLYHIAPHKDDIEIIDNLDANRRALEIFFEEE